MSRFPRLSLSVVIPVFNEERLVQAAIRRAVGAIARSVDEFEIVLIDDCSSDGTAALVDALGRELPQVRVVHNSRNLGQGGSLRLGFGLARHELVMHNAVDSPFDFDDLPALLSHFPEADVVVATRAAYPGVSLARRFVSRGHRTLIRALFGLRIGDYNFVQVYKRPALLQDQCFSEATAFITVEHIVRAHHAGYRVVAVPVQYHPRVEGRSASGNLRVVRQSLADMARLWTELRFRRAAKRVAPRGDVL